jgi:hypothetical protein
MGMFAGMEMRIGSVLAPLCLILRLKVALMGSLDGVGWVGVVGLDRRWLRCFRRWLDMLLAWGGRGRWLR